MQTAVEFFFNELQKMQYFIGNDMLEAYKEAKEMEKQQMKKIYSSPIMKNENGNLYAKSFEQYYNETYGK